jgi:predicted metalloprotease with PDZ domain
MAQSADWHFSLSLHPTEQKVHVTLQISGNGADSLPLKLPTWTPGYYHFNYYADHVSDFSAKAANGQSLQWQHAQRNTWCVQTKGVRTLTLEYDVKADRNFVTGNYVDSAHAFLSLAGICMYTAGQLKQPVTLYITPHYPWTTIATGLTPIGDTLNMYRAPDFDILYDSPILMGQLETLPSFSVKGIPHYFTGYNMGTFDHTQFITDLKKIVENASNIIGEIPYSSYIFLGTGPGRGGVEHLNSTAVSFTSAPLATREGRIRIYNFLAHEYFHHYNVKRIRPIELGPFDYENGSRTELLWVSEGFSVYYEYLIVHKSGLSTAEECIQQLRSNLLAYETKPGRLHQSLTQASWNTWTDGFFGDKENTISYYDKGPVLALLIDLQIRHSTRNRKSLDDVMRTLYYRYYKQLNRGFTPKEFQEVCEKTAGISLTELFTYVSTVQTINYSKYFAYAGLTIDDASEARTFEIKRMPHPDKLQTAIYDSIF